MKRQNIPMSWEEYEVFERPFGWKVEYWDGQARLSPRHIGVKTRMALSAQPQPIMQKCYRLIPVTPAHRDRMIAGYIDAFADSVEFCDYPLEEVRNSAERDIQRYFSGKRGESLSASVMAFNDDRQELLGLALFVRKLERSPRLELLYVRPAFQRQGIATAMVRQGMKQLSDAGFQQFFSAYHICNRVSRQWHHRFGLEDFYDLYYIQHREGWLRNEIWRREKLGLLEGLEELKRERERWRAELELSGRH